MRVKYFCVKNAKTKKIKMLNIFWFFFLYGNVKKEEVGDKNMHKCKNILLFLFPLRNLAMQIKTNNYNTANCGGLGI
jgi:hypothetical protein